MSTILVLKQFALSVQDEQLKSKIKTLEKYLESHNKNLKVFIEDSGILVYDRDIYLLKINVSL